MRHKCRPVDKDRGVSFAPKGETAKCVSLHTLDRLYGLGPITAFAMGEPPASGLQDDGKGGSVPVHRGCKQLVACVGSGKSGAIACVRGGVVAKQITSFPLGAVGQCTGALFGLIFLSIVSLLISRELGAASTFWAGTGTGRLIHVCSHIKRCSMTHWLSFEV